MAKKKDEGHTETDKVLESLEKSITKEYAQAEKELTEKITEYFEKYQKKNELKLKALSEGKITQEEYDKWKYGQLAIGDRWKEMKDSISQDLANASNIAKSITDAYMPEVYAINHNYGTYQVEKVSKMDTSYTLYDRHTVQGLFTSDNKRIYHKYGKTVGKHIKEGKLKDWEKKQVQSVMTQAILQGESIGKIATRLHNAVGDSVLAEDIKNADKMTAEQISKELIRRNRNASIRNARTTTTGVENSGRIDAYMRAENMGIKLQQQWVATLDDRTRHEHRMLDGMKVPVGEKFEVDGYELAYPADPNGEPEMVYNCRCTLIPALDGFSKDLSDTSLRHNANLSQESYSDWKNSHDIKSDPIDKQDKIAEIMKRKYGKEYASY